MTTMDDQAFMLRQQIDGFVEGTVSLHAFRDWFRAQPWQLGPPGDWTLPLLVTGTDKRLAIFNSGDYTESQLQASLSGLLARVDGREAPGPDPLEVTSPIVRSWKAEVGNE